jgi:hypothetical protein
MTAKVFRRNRFLHSMAITPDKSPTSRSAKKKRCKLTDCVAIRAIQRTENQRALHALFI